MLKETIKNKKRKKIAKYILWLVIMSMIIANIGLLKDIIKANENGSSQNLGSVSQTISLTNPNEEQGETLYEKDAAGNPTAIYWKFSKLVSKNKDALTGDELRGISVDTFATFAGSGLGKPEIKSISRRNPVTKLVEETIPLNNIVSNADEKDGIKLLEGISKKYEISSLKDGLYEYIIKTPIVSYRQNYVLDVNSTMKSTFSPNQTVSVNGETEQIGSGGDTKISRGTLRGVFVRGGNSFRSNPDNMTPSDFVERNMTYKVGDYIEQNKIRWFANAINRHREPGAKNTTINTTLDETQASSVQKVYIYTLDDNGYKFLRESTENNVNAVTTSLNPGEVMLVKREATVENNNPAKQKRYHTFGGNQNRTPYNPNTSTFESEETFFAEYPVGNRHFAYLVPFYGRTKIMKEWQATDLNDRTGTSFEITSDAFPNEKSIATIPSNGSETWDNRPVLQRWVRDENAPVSVTKWKRVNYYVKEHSSSEPPIVPGDYNLLLKVVYQEPGKSRGYQNIPVALTVTENPSTSKIAVAYFQGITTEQKNKKILDSIKEENETNLFIKRMLVNDLETSNYPSVPGKYTLNITLEFTKDGVKQTRNVEAELTVAKENTTSIYATNVTYGKDATNKAKILKKAVSVVPLNAEILDVEIVPKTQQVSESYAFRTMEYNFINTKIDVPKYYEETDACWKYGVIAVGSPEIDPNKKFDLDPYVYEAPAADTNGAKLVKIKNEIDINSYEFYYDPNQPLDSWNNKNRQGDIAQGGWVWGRFRIPPGAKAGDKFTLVFPKQIHGNMNDIGTDQYVGSISANINGVNKNIGYIQHELVIYTNRASDGTIISEEYRDKFIFNLNGNATANHPYEGTFYLGQEFRGYDGQPSPNGGIRHYDYIVKSKNGIQQTFEDHNQFNLKYGFVPGPGAYEAGAAYNEQGNFRMPLTFESTYEGKGFIECPDATHAALQPNVRFDYSNKYINTQNKLLNKYVLREDEGSITWRTVFNSGLNSLSPTTNGDSFFDVLVGGATLLHGNNQTPEELERNGDIKVWVTPSGNLTGVPDSTNEYMFYNNTVVPKVTRNGTNPNSSNKALFYDNPQTTDWFRANNQTTAEVWIQQNVDSDFFTKRKEYGGLRLEKAPTSDGHELIPTSKVGIKVWNPPPSDDGKRGYVVVADVTVSKTAGYYHIGNTKKYMNTMYSNQGLRLKTLGYGDGTFRMAIYSGFSGGATTTTTTTTSFSFYKMKVPLKKDIATRDIYEEGYIITPQDGSVSFVLRNKNDASLEYIEISDADGKVTFSDIPNGSYDLIEKVGNIGYGMSSSITVNIQDEIVTFNGDVFDRQTGEKITRYDPARDIVVKNYEKPRLKIIKRDKETGALLENFQIEIKKWNAASGDRLGPGSSTVVPYADGMDFDRYLLVETIYPEGYTADTYDDIYDGKTAKNYVLKVATDGKIYYRYDGITDDLALSSEQQFKPLSMDKNGDFVFYLDNVKIPNTYSEVKYLTTSFSILKREANTRNPVSGAEFTLFTDKETKNVATDSRGNRLVVRSGADGKAVFNNIKAYHVENGRNVAGGDYYLKETLVPTRYNQSAKNTVYHVNVDVNGRVYIYDGVDGNTLQTKKYETGVNENLVLYNSSLSGRFKIQKREIVDSLNELTAESNKTGKLLQGATFGLFYDEEATTPLKDPQNTNVNYTKTTGTNGEVEFVDLVLKDKPYYLYLKEMTAPNGYQLLEKSLRVTINPNGSTTVEKAYAKAIENGKTVYEWKKLLEAQGSSEHNFIGIVSNKLSPKKSITIRKRDWGQVQDFMRITAPKNIWMAPDYLPAYPNDFDANHFVFGQEGVKGNLSGREAFRPLSAGFTLKKENSSGEYVNFGSSANKITRGFGNNASYALSGNDVSGLIEYDGLTDGNYKIVEEGNPGVPPGYEWQSHPLANTGFFNENFDMVVYFSIFNGKMKLSKEDNKKIIEKNNKTPGKRWEKMIPFLEKTEYSDKPNYTYYEEDDIFEEKYNLILGNTPVFKLKMKKVDDKTGAIIQNAFDVKLYKYTGYLEEEWRNVPHTSVVSYYTDPKTKMVYATVGLPGTITNGIMENETLDTRGFLPGLYYIEEVNAPSGYVKPDGLIPLYILEDGHLAQITVDGQILDNRANEGFKLVGTLPNNQKNPYGNPFEFENVSYDASIRKNVLEFKFKNIKKPSIKIHKTSSLNNNPLENAQFTLFEDEAATRKVVLQNANGQDDENLNPKTTNANGDIVFENLNVGYISNSGTVVSKNYYLKETQAPTHHKMDESIYRISVSEKGKVTIAKKENGLWVEKEENVAGSGVVVENDILTLNIENIKKTTSLVLRKRDLAEVEEFLSKKTPTEKSQLTPNSYDKNKFYEPNKHFRLLKATFTLYQKTGAGEFDYTQVPQTSTLKNPQTTTGFGHGGDNATNDSGEIIFANLPDGEYAINETNVPPGYEWDSYPNILNNFGTNWQNLYIYFKIENGILTIHKDKKNMNVGDVINGKHIGQKIIPFVPTNSYQELNPDEVNMILLNTPVYRLRINKIDAVTKAPIKIGGSNQKAVVRIYAYDSKKTGVDKTHILSNRLTIGESGYVDNDNVAGLGYAPGLYYLEEIQAPEGYSLPAINQSLGSIKIPFYITRNGSLANIKADGSITTLKDGKEIEIAHLPAGETNPYVGLIEFESESRIENGRKNLLSLNLKNNPLGKVKIVKESFSETVRKQIQVTEDDGRIVTKEVEEPRRLENATFGIFEDSLATRPLKITNSNVNYQVTTDGNGVAMFTNLYPSNREEDGRIPNKLYYIKEVTAPQGYRIDSTVYEVSVAENGATKITGKTGADGLLVTSDEIDGVTTEYPNIAVITIKNKKNLSLVIRTRSEQQLADARMYDVANATSTITNATQVDQIVPNTTENFKVLDAKYSLKKIVNGAKTEVNPVVVAGKEIGRTNNLASGILTYEALEPGEYELSQTVSPINYLPFRNDVANKIYKFSVDENGNITVLPSNDAANRKDVISLSANLSPNQDAMSLIVLNTQGFYLKLRKTNSQGVEITNSVLTKQARFVVTDFKEDWLATFLVNGSQIANNNNSLITNRYNNIRNSGKNPNDYVLLKPNTLYLIKEAQAPDGYKMLGGDIETTSNRPIPEMSGYGIYVPFAITENGQLIIPAKSTVENIPGNQYNKKHVLSLKNGSPVVDTEFLEKYPLAKILLETENTIDTNGVPTVVLKYINHKFILPKAGGNGILSYIVAGTMIMIISVFVIYYKKRKYN